MPVPHTSPAERPEEGIVPAHEYAWREPVWVYDDGSWHPGLIEDTSRHATTVMYQTDDLSRLEFIIRTAPYLARRQEDNLFIDIVGAVG